MIDPIWGVIAGVTAIILTIIINYVNLTGRINKFEHRFTDIASKMETFQSTARELLSSSETINDEFNKIRKSPIIRPDLPLLINAQWRFVEKFYIFRHQKEIIADKVASLIKEKDHVLLDSGSTLDSVTSKLLHKEINDVHIFSNNVFAAIYLAGTTGTSKIKYWLYPGYFDDRYAAVFSEFKASDFKGINLFILAATAFNHKYGIMVHKGFNQNKNFKKAALDAFKISNKGELIIAIDPSKLLKSINKYEGVLNTDEWNNLINDKDLSRHITIITSPTPDDLTNTDKQNIIKELDKFRHHRPIIKVDDI